MTEKQFLLATKIERLISTSASATRESIIETVMIENQISGPTFTKEECEEAFRILLKLKLISERFVVS